MTLAKPLTPSPSPRSTRARGERSASYLRLLGCQSPAVTKTPSVKSISLLQFVCLGWLALVSVPSLTHAQQPAPEAEPEPGGRRVFVPLDELQGLLERDRQGVLMPRKAFRQLYGLAKQNTLDKPQPPQAIGVRDVTYAARVEEDQLVISATLKITKFTPGWQLLPLDFRDLSIEKALLGDQPAKLGRDPQAEGRLVLLLDQPGTQTLTLELSRPLTAVGSDKLAAFGLAPLWAAEFTLAVPPQKHLQWNGVAVERPAANDQPATFKLAFGGQKQIELRITDRPTEQSTEGLVFAHTSLGVRASPEEVTWQAVTALQVFGKPLDRLQFKVPVGLQIISITSPGLESWEFGPKVPDATESILDLVYRQPFQEPREVTLKGVLATKTGESWQVPNLKLANVASHITQLLVTTAPGMRLQLEEAVGAQRTATVADAASVDEPPSKPLAADASSVGHEGLQFSAWREDFVLRFTTLSKAREMSAAVVTLLDITANGLDLQSRATIESRFAPLFDVSLTLPAEWTVTDVLVNQQRVAWETLPQVAGIHTLRVAFETPLPAEQPAVVQLSAHYDPKDWPLEEGAAPFSHPLPEVRVLQSNAVEGTVVIAAERDLDVQLQEVKGLAPTLLDPALAARLSYEYQDTHYSGKVQVVRKPSRISAHTLAFHRLDQETFLSHLEARLTIEGGGARKLQVSLPESAGTNLRLELTDSTASIVEQTTAVPANGRRVWTLALDQRAYGNVLLLVDVTQPRKAAKEFVPPAMQLIGAERETGQLAFEAEPDQQLDIVATEIDAAGAAGAALPDIDPTDLFAPTGYLPKERIVAAYSYVLPGYRSKLTERRFARMAVPTAICDLLNLVSILGETGELQHEATFQIRAVGVQSLQVTLPKQAQLWATLLDDVPIEVRRTSAAYLIPLKGSENADPSVVEDPSRVRKLKLYYRTQVGPLTAASTLKQTPPGITVLNGDGTEQPLEILQQVWTVHHPRQTEFVADGGSFIADQQHLRLSFLGELLQGFQVDSPRNLFWKAVTLLSVAGVAWVLGLLWRRSGARGFFALGLLLFAGCFLFALLLPATQSAREAARRSESRNKLSSLGYAVGTADVHHTVEGDDEAKPATRNLPAPTGAAININSQFGDFLPPMEGGRTITTTGSTPAATAQPADVAGRKSESAPEEKKADSPPAEELPPKSEVAAVETKSEAMPKEAKPADPAKPRIMIQEEEADLGLDDKTDVKVKKSTVARARDRAFAFAAQPAAPGQPQGAGGGEGRAIDGRLQAAPPQAAVPLPSIHGKGVLSLALSLEPPADSQHTTYTYRGRLQQKPPELVIAYQNRARMSFDMLVVEMSVILICWFARRWSLTLRGLILTLGIGVPLALMTIVPKASLPLLDVVLSGTILGGLLWLIVAVVAWFRSPQWWNRLWNRLNGPLVTAAAVLIVVGCSTVSVSAEDKPAEAQAVKKEPVQKSPAPPPSKEQRDPELIFVPAEALTDPLKVSQVFLPYAKFVELYRQAHPEEPVVKNSPVAATITEALYAAELVPAANGKQAAVKITGRFVCYSFRDSQVTLPLPLGKVAVGTAQLDGSAAPLVAGTEQNPLAVLISEPGLHVVDLQFTVPVQLTGPAGVFSLALTDVPSGLLRFKVPAGDLNYRVNGSSGAFRRIAKDAETAELLIPVAAGGAFQVSWQPRQNRADVAGVIHVDSTSAVLLSEEGPRMLSHWIFQVRQGSLAEVAFSLPEGLGVRKIEGQDVGGWEVGGEGEARQLKIFLRRKVEDATQLKFDLFLKQPADDLETTYVVPQFAPQNITRETGTLAVLAEKQFAVRVGNITGLSQIEPQQVPLARLGTEFANSPLLAYRFANRPYQLELVVSRRQPQLKVTARHFAHLDPRKVQQQNRFQIRLTGAPRAGVSLVLPQGYLVQDVQAPEIADWHISGREDSADMDAEALLHLEFAAPRVGNFDVVLVGKTLRQPENLKGEVSLPYPLETDELDTQLLTTLDPIYTGSATMLDNWKSIDPAELARLFLPAGTASNQLGFSSPAPAPAPVLFDLQQAQPRLSGQVLTLLTVGEDTLDYLFALQWNINTAGADRFVFTTPEWLAGKLDFPEGHGPRRRSVTQESTGDGRSRWTIMLEDPQRERYFIVARAVLPPSAKGEVAAPGFVLEQVTPGQDPPLINPLETQTHYVVLVNQSQTQLTSAVPDAVETIPAEDLTRAIRVRQDLIDQAAEVVRVRTVGAGVTWKQQRFQAEQLLPAAVNLAHHITVLAPDGSWREQVSYRVRNRKRQFLAVKLPAGSQVLSLFVKGLPARPVSPAKETGFTLIPLPKTVEGDVAFEVVMVLAGQLNSGPLRRPIWELARQEVDIPIPSVVSPEESAEYGIAVSQTTWTVYAPRNLDVDVLKRPEQTNVNEVTETLQVYDQTIATLNEVSELIAINSNTFNRRVQAQSYSNAKQLGVALHNFHDTNLARNSEEVAKQREVQQRISQLEKSIKELEVRNNDQGLTVQQDVAGNTIVLDQRSEQGGQQARISEFYTDNTIAPANKSEPAPPMPPSVAGKARGKGQKGNVNRDNLRGQNFSQVKELAQEQQKKLSAQNELADVQEGQRSQSESKPRSYEFSQPTLGLDPFNNTGTGQMATDTAQAVTTIQKRNQPGAPFAPGPPRDLTRRGDIPKLGTIVGQERQTTFDNSIQVPYRQQAAPPAQNFGRNAGPVARMSRSGSMVDGPGPGPGQVNTAVEQELANLVQQFDRLLKELRYAEAEVLAQKARQLDPQNPTAEIMKWKAKFAKRNATNKQLKDRKEEDVWSTLESVEQLAIPFDDRDPIAFAKNWQERGMGGLGGGGSGGLPGWTSSGGLSLLIEIPTDGKVYSFSKISGGARLTLAVRPHQTWQLALGLVWTITWTVILLVITWTLSRPQALAALYWEAPWFLAALGLVTFFLVGSESGAGIALSLLMFIVGTLWIAFRKPARSDAQLGERPA